MLESYEVENLYNVYDSVSGLGQESMPKLDERDTDKIVPIVFYVIIAVTVTITVIQLIGVGS